MPTKHGYLSVL